MNKREKNPFWTDLRVYYHRAVGSTKPSFSRRRWLWTNELGLQCVALYRFGVWSRELWRRSKLLGFIPIITYKFLHFFQRVIYQVDVELGTFGCGFYIGHMGTIYIGPSKIGKNFCVTHNVTIGVGHDMNSGATPTIGDNVWVGTGSIITGGIKIGNGVTISAGSFLSRDVPDNCLVAGNPARVIMRDYDNSRLVLLPPELRDQPPQTTEDRVTAVES